MSDRQPHQPHDGISPDELRALQVLQELKQAAAQCGHQFAGRMITPSGQRYVVATDEPGNIAAWIFNEEEKARHDEQADR